MPEKRRLLTDQEKWQCTLRWLNSLYTAFFYDELLPENEPCPECPCFYICPCGQVEEGVIPPVSISMNFRVIEQFTGAGTVVGPLFPHFW